MLRRIRIAIIELNCPHCRQSTRAELPDDLKERGPEPMITCRECGKQFKFKKGMEYSMVGTTSAIVK